MSLELQKWTAVFVWPTGEKEVVEQVVCKAENLELKLLVQVDASAVVNAVVSAVVILVAHRQF